MSEKKNKSSLVILTRNEIAGMTALINRIPFDQVDEVFVVDFNSTDGTRELVKQHGVKLIKQVKPGRGEAFALAVKRAKGDHLVFFSPDGNEDPNDIPLLLKRLDQGYDLVIASRFFPASRNEEDDQTIKLRAWANRGFTLLANLLFGGRLTDSINGYRAITKPAFNQLKLDGTVYV